MRNIQARIPALFLALALTLSLSVAAVTPRYVVTTRCTPALSFSGTTATCDLRVSADKGAKITGTLTLYRGSTEVKSWDVDETTSVSFRDTCTVTKGYSYKLVADLTVTGAAGTDDVYEYVSKTCS